MHGVIPFLQHLSQATILAHNVLVCAYTVTSHDTFTRCASVLGHVTDSRYLYLSVLILVTSLVSSVLVLVTGHDTCILSHLLSYHHHHHHSRPASQILRTVKAWISLWGFLSNCLKYLRVAIVKVTVSSLPVIPTLSDQLHGNKCWNKLNCCLSWSEQRREL